MSYEGDNGMSQLRAFDSAFIFDTLYRERYNFASKEVDVKRDGILMGLARKRYGSWNDLSQAAFLGLWEDAGHKHPYSTDSRRKDAPLEYSLFIRDPKNPKELTPLLPGEADPAFEAWAWKRGDSPASSERRRNTTYRQREKDGGEEWKLVLVHAHRENSLSAKADHNAAYLGGKKPIWNARHVILLDIAKSHVRGIPLALKWVAVAKVLRVLHVILQHADPRRKFVTRVKDWPLVATLLLRGWPGWERPADSTRSGADTFQLIEATARPRSPMIS